MITFEKIRWKNFLSTGNSFTEIQFNRSPSTLVVGENGSGKSTMLDAVCFSLFNKPFRKISKAQLINSINNKKMVVEIEFRIGQKEFKVIRGVKPSVFEVYCDGQMLDQDAAVRDTQKYLEDSILKMNFKSFTQIVILGSASFTPFMQLPTASRREIIEDILDIEIFTTMNQVLREKISFLRDEIRDVETEVEVAKSKATVQRKYIEQLEKDKRIKVEKEDKRFRNLKKSFSGFLFAWTVSATWVCLTASNAFTMIIANSNLIGDLYFISGFILWSFGFIIEIIADQQKKKFKLDEENKDKFISSGLWSISRHPNYFGEITLWFGISIISFPVLEGGQFITLISPIFVYLLLTRVSGVNMLEKRSDDQWGNKSEYQEYKKNTPVLFPFIKRTN